MNKFKKTMATVALATSVLGAGSALTASPAAALPDFAETCDGVGGISTTTTFITYCVLDGIVYWEWNW